MARIIGRLINIGIGKESSRGTAVAPTYWVKRQDLDFDDNVLYADNDSGVGNIAEKNDAVVVEEWAEGSYGGKIQADSVGVELVGLFGQSPTSVQRGTSGVYDHTFAMLNSNQHASLTLAYKDSNVDLAYALAMVNTWNLEVELQNFVRRSVGIVAKKGAAATNTVAHADENEFIPSHITVKFADALSGLDGASAVNARRVTMEVNKNVERLHAFNQSKAPVDIVNKQLSISGEIEFYYEDTTYRDYVLNGTQKAMRIDMTNTDVTIGSSHNPALRFDLAKLKFSEKSRGTDNNDVSTITLSYEGLFSMSDAQSIAARLTNEETSY